MKSTAIAVALLALPLSSPVLAEDVNRTGQPQTQQGGSSGTGSKTGDADTMGGGTTGRTEPSDTPQRAPQNQTHPDKGPKTNAEPDSSNQQRN